MQIVHSLPEPLRLDAARLYWQAFGGKLGQVLGPERLALVFLERSIETAHAMVALGDDGALLGLIGFRSSRGGFVESSLETLVRVYGPLGGLWRWAAMRALVSEIDNDRLLIDGICVLRDARGRGIGTALIEALAASPVARGYAEMRLDVIDTNIRARALYDRLGFHAVRTERLGPLRHLFGFDAAVTMVRRLT